jgi:putative membrane-bound dehydrogenase-like protein
MRVVLWLGLFLLSVTAVQATDFQVGLARVEVTPTEPIRLSGYAVRSTAYEAIDTPLHARAMVLRESTGPLRALVSVDSIGLPGDLTVEIAKLLKEKHGIQRDDLVISGTHSHTAPQLSRGLDNLYTIPQSAEEQAKTDAYTLLVRDRVVEAVGQAIENLAPAKLTVNVGEATFAKNRRGLKDGKWIGFSVEAGGVVDHTVPMLRITAADGTVRAVLYNYACHCTTFGPGHNRVNGDWAGYAAAELEAAHPGMLAFSVIGCGADANPDREGPTQLEKAKAQGHELASAVEKQLAAEGLEVTAPLQSTFGFAGIAPERPSAEALTKQLLSTQPQVRRHAENMLATLARMGRLPETYPMPIHVWRFGDQFAMVFMGGEVVADYAHRIRKELPAATWVSAYCDDVFGYVASERMRAEGGYEVDESMIYYNQPGRWVSGTEEVIFRRIHELYDNKTPDRALSVEEALKTFSLPEGYEIEVVAAEPLIVDPVNFAVAPDGKLWVVEMRDYPLGMDGKGEPGGRIRVLTDENGDGRYDSAVTFMDKVRYVTGVLPWKDGAWVSAAPHVSFARDTNGDGTADEVTPWLEGFIDANPQHRINGFERGLDGWIYLAAGDSTDHVKSLITGEVVQTSRRDIRFHPKTGKVEALGGQTQNARVRDDWGHWFGNTNSEPLMQFPIEDRDLRRNPWVPSPPSSVRITDPEVAPPVHPTSRTVDRFNDLWAADRFTSACGTGIFRDTTWGPEMYGAAFVCEPVHNLVVRYKLVQDGVTFKAVRFAEDTEREFLSSSDNWFRPTRAMTGPDGCLWIADMYRHVIEHPEWIPEAWQARLDVRAGEDRGRIYRVRKKGQPHQPLPNLAALTDVELVKASLWKSSKNGWERDTAQQLLSTRDTLSPTAIKALRGIVSNCHENPVDMMPLSRRQAIAILNSWGQLQASDLCISLRSGQPQAVAATIQCVSPEWLEGEALRATVPELVEHESLEVRYELALKLGDCTSPNVPQWLGELILSDPNDPWLRAAILSSAPKHADALLPLVIQKLPADETRATWVGHLVATILADKPEAGLARIFKAIGGEAEGDANVWKLAAMADMLRILRDRGTPLSQLLKAQDAELQVAFESVQPTFQRTRMLIEAVDQPLPERLAAIQIAGELTEDRACDVTLLYGLLAPRWSIEVTSAAIARLTQLEDVGGILSAWPTLSPIARREAQTLFVARPGTALALLKAVEAGKIPVGDLDAATRNALAESKSEKVRELAAKVLATAAKSTRGEVLAKFQPVLTLTGDDAHGRVLFEKKCATCHKHRDLGNEIGPQLVALQNKSAEFLLRAILDPNQAVESKYTGYVATTKDGRTFTGMIIDETATSLTLARTDGKKDVVLRVDIEELKSTGKSFMPEGLEQELTTQDLADVFQFVQGK